MNALKTRIGLVLLALVLLVALSGCMGTPAAPVWSSVEVVGTKLFTGSQSGKVYALDISLEPVNMLRERAEREGLTNIELTVGPAEKTLLCDACADVVFFGIDLHDFAYPNLVLKNARVMIKSGGRLADVDWKKIETPMGPPLNIRFDEVKAAALIHEAGFDILETRQLPPWHYMIIAAPV